MQAGVRWTSADLELMPEDGKRYEVIDGELHVSRQPSWQHQFVGVEIMTALHLWSTQTGAGFTNDAPGVILVTDDDVAPDIVWIAAERLPGALDAAGHLQVAPDLVVEVLSPGAKDEQRDREAKRKTYSRHGVREYWIVDWRHRQVEVFRREHAALQVTATLLEGDALTSPLLPGFALPVSQFSRSLPPVGEGG